MNQLEQTLLNMEVGDTAYQGRWLVECVPGGWLYDATNHNEQIPPVYVPRPPPERVSVPHLTGVPR